MDYQGIRNALERLTGQKATGIETNPEISILKTAGEGLGYSQLNELLLLLGFDRISRAFFRYLIDGDTRYEPGMAFETEQQLEDAIERFQKLAILLYGSVKYAFKVLSRSEVLEKTIKNLDPILDTEFKTRHRPILPIVPIPADETYLTGYLIERELHDRLQRDPADLVSRKLEEKRVAAVEAAKKNQHSYLASDHLDVYVATSMREKHEFKGINRITSQIFDHHALCDLNLRWFDPTQAYCQNRIDKGLAEALMLRRASCTIYLAQEVDTLGKDSELASTLAQGKPVVAYIPEISREDFDKHLEELKDDGLAGGGEQELLIDQLSIYCPEAAWKDPRVQSWIANQAMTDINELKELVFDKMRDHFNRRARILRDSHPLGIQVHLSTGVSNGVLVVRTIDNCAELVRRILLQSLEFRLSETESALELREVISDCVFRVMAKDSMLVNTFWNFYLNPAR